jgi:hypothetical protein
MLNGIRNNYNSINGLIDLLATSVYTQYLYVNGQLITPIINNIFTGLINQPLTLLGINELQQTTFNGSINQSSGITNILQLNAENTNITGTLTQTSGNSSLGNLSVGIITQTNNNYISQNQNGSYTNVLGPTNINNLVVTNSIQLPSDVSIPGSTYNNNKI